MAKPIVIDIQGDKALRRAFKQLAASAQRRIARSAVRKALSPINKAAKQNAKAIKDTGLLAKSIGAKMIPASRARNKSLVVGFVGPRPGFRTVVGRFVGSVGVRNKPKNPVKYAHLVEFGTAPHTIIAKRAKALAVGSGFRRRVNHPGTSPRPFMRPAFDSQVGNAKRKMVSEFKIGLAREAKRVRSKSR
jgi:HK97 gp10 family phage protein